MILSQLTDTQLLRPFSLLDLFFLTLQHPHSSAINLPSLKTRNVRREIISVLKYSKLHCFIAISSSRILDLIWNSDWDNFHTGAV